MASQCVPVVDVAVLTSQGCDLCAGVMGTEVLKDLLGRGPRRRAPWGLQYDAYLQRFRTTWRPGGNANPVQRLMIRLIRAQLEALQVRA